MKTWKAIGKALLFPPIAILILLIPLSVAMLIYAFAFENPNPYGAYASYFVSAYTLTILCVRAPWLLKKAKNFKHENKYIVRYSTDTHLRAKISLYATLFFNAAYTIFQLVLGIYHSTVWYYALAGYYFLLAAMRYFLLKETLKEKPGANYFWELLHYRFCGILLVLMNLALGVIVAYIVWQGRGFRHHPITTIAMAAYTFATLARAIVNVLKYRRYQSPVLSAAKAISLAAASVSVLTLETAMLSAFGEENSELFRGLMTSITGAAVCAFILAMALYMIVSSTKKIKTLKNNNSET